MKPPFWTIAIATALAAPLAAQVTQRVSVTASGGVANSWSVFPAISADGRYVAFLSAASNLVLGDTNHAEDIFVRDRVLGTTERVSVSSTGAQANGSSGGFTSQTGPAISADGRYVVFVSEASNLVAGDTNAMEDVFVRDRQAGITELVSVSSSGVQSEADCLCPSISADGRFVVFSTYAANLVPGDTNQAADVFVHDRRTGTTERVDLDPSGAQVSDGAFDPWISANGRYVFFESRSPDFVAGDTNGTWDVFLRDLRSGTTELVGLTASGRQANGAASSATISEDGRYVAFLSDATNLVPGDTNGAVDAFVYDRRNGTTERVSVDSAGAEANGPTSYVRISADGRTVSFMSSATNLVPGDTNGFRDLFVRDRELGTTERINLDWAGTARPIGDDVAFSGDGSCAAFESLERLDVGSPASAGDIYVRDRFGGTSFTSLCDPGAGGVFACPCANPPGGAGRGCDNSAGTGGAILSAAGGTFLSSDTLAFTTSAETPASASVLLQGSSSVASGAVYGQGVRCVGGTLERLFTKTASGGGVTAPDFLASDPTVSARSAAKGNPISAGENRWYLFFYRDPVVLGGCPSGSTFNTTQTGLVTWSP